ncbi:MAG: hypothetical protein EOP02_06065 [Proteobacteria bacterium]|nr:MAG: hypothetical protein EOP02_06065 [Pseudomonadota bacterium]
MKSQRNQIEKSASQAFIQQEQDSSMKQLPRLANLSAYIAGALFISMVASCGGSSGKDPVLGMDTVPVVPVGTGTDPDGTADTTAPTVTLTQPANNATGVARNAKVVAVFSEEMDAASISADSVVVKGPDGVAIAGTVTYIAGAKSANFKPTTPALLPAGAQMTATISTAAKDVAGNALAAAFVWGFTTGATTDTTRPTVTLTVPVNGAQNVLRNSRISATFSEDMDPARGAMQGPVMGAQQIKLAWGARQFFRKFTSRRCGRVFTALQSAAGKCP